MTIKNQKNWMLKRYFIPCISLYGIIYCQYIFPIKSIKELGEKIMLCLLIILLSALFITVIERLINKSIMVDEHNIIIKSTLKTRKYNLLELNNIEYEKGKRTRSGHYGNQLRFVAGRKQYIINSTEYDDLDEFVDYLKNRVKIEYI